MRGRSTRCLGAMLVIALAACAPGGGDEEPRDPLEGRQGLTPTYAPDATAGGGSSTTTGGSVTSTTAASTTTTKGGAAPARPTGSIDDPKGDVTPGDGTAPAWADLVGARLTRNASHFELRVELGDAAPSTSGRADRTMNVATFFDVDGDGQVDYEIWANLSDGGWDGSWFDDRTDEAAFSDGAALDVVVERGELVVRFPPEYVGDAKAFRWSLASEYGSYVALGTQLTSRDDAPDADAAVGFPG